MFYTVYKTTNLINGKFYVGKHQTQNLDDGYLGSGKHLKRAIVKHGIEHFEKEILFVFDNEAEMNAKEAELVTEEFCNRDDTYNLCPGGQGGFGYIYSNRLWDTQQRYEQSQVNFEKLIDGNQKYFMTVDMIEHGKKISSGLKKFYSSGRESFFKGKKHSAETKRKMSEASKGQGLGEKNSQYGTMWITNGIENRKIKKVDKIPEGWYKGRN